MKYYLIFTSWTEAIKKVSFVSLLRERTGMSFLSSKRVLEAILLEEEIILEMSGEASAKQLRKEALKLGVKSKVIVVGNRQSAAA
ncbi:MAG TPA: hypothetical protein VGO45_05100 [Bacteroidia bacterium]|jgi:hypothetical protein|nr:hypothetical protein [Bacteroidia bacterium]